MLHASLIRLLEKINIHTGYSMLRQEDAQAAGAADLQKNIAVAGVLRGIPCQLHRRKSVLFYRSNGWARGFFRCWPSYSFAMPGG
jgi:hypothetical protein